MSRFARTSLFCLAAALSLSACGSSSSGSASSGAQGPESAARAAAALRRAAEERAPKGASPTLRAIYATFPAPKPEPGATGSAAAIRNGVAACRGKTPVEVKEEFFAAASQNLTGEQGKMIARIDSFERNSDTDASFTAGQLAADTYGATLPEATAQYGYQGCVYALARGLERKLAPGK